MLIIFAALTFLACGIFGLNDYLWQGYLGIFYVGGLIAIAINKKVGFWPAILFFYITLLSLAYMINPLYFTRGLEMPVIMGLQILGMQSYLYVVMIVLPFLLFSDSYIDMFLTAFVCLGLSDTYIMLIKMLFGGHPFFLMNNMAMDGAFVACCLPLFFYTYDSFKQKGFDLFYRILVFVGLVGVPIVMCFLTKSSSGVLGMGVAISGYLLCKSGFKKGQIIWASMFSAMVAFLGFAMQKKDLFSGSGRYEIWQHTWSFWQAQHKGLTVPFIPASIGGGLGSFFMYGPTIQLQDAIRAKFEGIDIFFWLHNDWYQILFETGWIGLILTAIVFTVALYRARRSPAIFAGLATFGAVNFIQMGLRHFIWATLGVLFISRAFRPPDKSSPETAYKNNVSDY